jgi:hypothetical protein
MIWQDIKVSEDSTHFLFDGKAVFDKRFIEVLKFHSPGLAPVKDESGSFHIDYFGKQLYADRFTRTFGYYCNRAAVRQLDKWFHITEKGFKVYSVSFAWVGNFQENLCPVRDKANNYFHINLDGDRIYSENFVYCGDFKDGIACVKTQKGDYRHILTNGLFLHKKEFSDIGIYHKNYATAKDKDGWHHIDKNGNDVYKQRFLAVEPFYNGYALVTEFNNSKLIIDESGKAIITI